MKKNKTKIKVKMKTVNKIRGLNKKQKWDNKKKK